MKLDLSGRLPVRGGVTEVTYHRGPIYEEIAFGYGATHYRDFTIEECCHPGTRVLKHWVKADDDLRYYRD